MPELKPITRPAKRRLFSTYDMEWIPADPVRAAEEGFRPLELRIIGAYDERGFRSYAGVEAFLRGEMTGKNRGRWYYAHAGGSFDMRFLLEWLVDNPINGLSVHCAFKGASAMIVELKRGRNSWYLLDSYFLLRQSLRDIGKWVGAEKGGGSECARCGPGTTCLCLFYAGLPELREYNEQDCRILYAGIKSFEDVVLSLGGQLEMTVAATAMGLFRRRYLKSAIKTSQAVNELSRHAYIASRVEAHAMHVENALYYDINSSFPHEMTKAAPGNYLGTSKTFPWRKDSLYLAKSVVSVPDHLAIPPLPYRSRSGRIFFPTGVWESWFTNIDLEFLQEAGGEIVSVSEVLEFEPFHDLADYAREIYELRKNARTNAEKAVLKFLANSCYGKFAESPEKQQMYVNPPPEFFEATSEDPESDLPQRNEVMPGIYEYTELKYPPHTHVPIAAHITARARRALTRLMIEADSIGSCYYCDTDGLAVSNDVLFPVGKELGDLKLEKQIYAATFPAPKLYSTQEKEGGDWDVKAKGFSKVLPYMVGVGGEAIPTGDPSRQINYDDFVRLLEHKEIPLAHFLKIRESVATGDLAPREEVRTKRFRGIARSKREWATDCRSSSPWDIEQIREE